MSFRAICLVAFVGIVGSGIACNRTPSATPPQSLPPIFGPIAAAPQANGDDEAEAQQNAGQCSERDATGAAASAAAAGQPDAEAVLAAALARAEVEQKSVLVHVGSPG